MFGESGRCGYVDRQQIPPVTTSARVDYAGAGRQRAETTEAQPVGSYTITFTPDDASNASAMVRVDLGVAGARITELTVRAGSGDGLVPGELPGFDLGRLMRAIAPAGPTAPAFELSATPSAVSSASYTTTEPAAARKSAGRATAGRGVAKQTAAKQAAAKKTAKATPS